jgi:hypothetical protein
VRCNPFVAELRWRGCSPDATSKPSTTARPRAVGSLAATAATNDIVDACVVEGALRRRHDLVVSSDETDLHAIAAAASRHLEIDRP